MQLNIMYRKALYVFLSCWLVIFTVTPSFASYNPNKPHTRWFYDQLINDPTVKSTVEVKANRDYPVTVVDPDTGAKDTITKNQKTKIKIPANAAKVGKRLLKGGAGAVIGAAVYDILGKAVDWVLDPENNRVKYKEPDNSGGQWYMGNGDNKVFSNTPQSAFVKYHNKMGINIDPLPNKEGLKCTMQSNGLAFYCIVEGRASATAFKNTDYQSPEWQYVPIDTVAKKVIEHADDGQAPAMQVMSDTALDALEAGELDNQLESSAEPKQYGSNEYEPGTEPNPDPDPENPDPENPDPENPNPENPNPEPTPTEWPAFCDWAGVVCEWIGWSKTAHQETQTAIAENTEAQNETNQKIDDVTVTREDGQKALAVDFPKFCDWATLACDYYDWAMEAWEPPENENNEIDIQQPDIGDWQGKATASYVQFDGQCPADVTIPINYMGASTNLSISYQPFCHFASMIKPAVILGAWISAMLIISGGRAKES